MGRIIVSKVLLGQLAVTVASSALCAFFFGPAYAGAALAGGAISMLSGLAFAARLFAPGADAEPKRLVRAFYVGAVVKFVVTVALFSAALAVLERGFGALLGTFMATLPVYWLALLWTDDYQQST